MANTKITITVDTSYLEATLTELRTLYADRLRDLEYEYQRRVLVDAMLERIEHVLMERNFALHSDVVSGATDLATAIEAVINASSRTMSTATAPGKTKPVAFYLNLAEEKPNE